MTLTLSERRRLKGHAGHVVWFTGLPASGKSTVANALEAALHARGIHTYLLDGDHVRRGLGRDLGFTAADRIENIRRVAEVAKLMLDAGLVVITAFISPFRRERAMARDLIGPGQFTEVHMSAPLQTCEARDPKGLYRRARAGALPDMSGIDSPYEVPEAPDCAIDSTTVTVTAAVACLLKRLEPALMAGETPT